MIDPETTPLSSIESLFLKYVDPDVIDVEATTLALTDNYLIDECVSEWSQSEDA